MYGILFEIHRHQPFNQCLLFFIFVDNTFIAVLMLQILLFLFVVIIYVIHGFQIFYRIILINIDVSYLSVREVSLVLVLSSFASFLNDLDPGGNEGTCGGSH